MSPQVSTRPSRRQAAFSLDRDESSREEVRSSQRGDAGRRGDLAIAETARRKGATESGDVVVAGGSDETEGSGDQKRVFTNRDVSSRRREGSEFPQRT